jgi:hypothetical protein
MENAQREAGQGLAVIPRFGWDASYWSKEMYRIFGLDPGRRLVGVAGSAFSANESCTH